MTEPPSTSASLRSDPDFVRYWMARQISVLGSLVTAVVMPVLIYRVSNSPSLTALTTVLEGLPYLMIGLFAGALADRWDRRRVMITADLACAVTIGSVPIAYFASALTVPHLLAAAFLTQFVFVFFDGAAFGALPTLVGRERIGEANAAVWGFGSVLDLSVPMGVGVALAIFHPADLLVVDALSFVGSALFIRAIRRAMTGERQAGHANFRPRELLGDVREGLDFLWNHAGVRAMTIIGTLQSCAGAGFMALSVPYADRLLHIGTSGWRFGLLFSTWGFGGIVAAWLAPRLLRTHSTGWLTRAAMPISAAAGIATVLASAWWLASALIAVWGVAYQAAVINSISYRQEQSPEHLLGRVNTAGRMLSFGVGWTLGAVGAGLLAARVDLRPAMLIMVSIAAIGAGYGWWGPLRALARPTTRERTASQPRD